MEVASRMSEAWELARKCIGKAQKRQKSTYDRTSRPPNFAVGERVILLKPSEKTGEARKLARPFHGPYRVTELSSTNAYIRRVDRPQDDPVFVSLQRLRRCPDEIPDEFWPPDKSRKRKKAPKNLKQRSEESASEPQVPLTDLFELEVEESSPSVGPTKATLPDKWTNRLRGQPRTVAA